MEIQALNACMHPFLPDSILHNWSKGVGVLHLLYSAYHGIESLNVTHFAIEAIVSQEFLR
jgi:hypothetical protein